MRLDIPASLADRLVSLFSEIWRQRVDSHTKDNNSFRRFMEQNAFTNATGEWTNFFEPFGNHEPETPIPPLDECNLYI